ncbi:thermonuclease family protein [Brevibacillus sp. TJ4]|uniref:thermonuclease family protein n=1 Tax=Brevibacillus sp. TJ4 TaxID=3234853 RepID=UPI0037CE9843
MKRWLLCTLLAAVMLTACSSQGQPAPNGEMVATVKRVIDGDTVELENGERVRLIGVDTPETVKPNSPVEPYGKEASEYTKKQLTGQTVTLRFDVEPRDKYDRLLAYVYLPDGTFYNEQLVREGYARIMTIPPNVAYADLFLEAEREARENDRGLWALEDSPVPASAEENKKQAPAAAPEAPEGKPIKGNINSKGEKIYHVPGSPNYDRTIPEEWFATEEEAQAAGYRAPKR